MAEENDQTPYFDNISLETPQPRKRTGKCLDDLDFQPLRIPDMSFELLADSVQQLRTDLDALIKQLAENNALNNASPALAPKTKKKKNSTGGRATVTEVLRTVEELKTMLIQAGFAPPQTVDEEE